MGCGGSKNDAQVPGEESKGNPAQPPAGKQESTVVKSGEMKKEENQKMQQVAPKEVSKMSAKENKQSEPEGVAPAPPASSSSEPPVRPTTPADYEESAEIEHDDDLDAEVQLDKAGSAYSRREERPADNSSRLGLLDYARPSEPIETNKPWAGALKAPSASPEPSLEAPDAELQLEWVYGYRSFDTRQNVFFTAKPGEIVYMTAAIGVVYDTQANTQRFFGAGNLRVANGHSDDVTALAMHPDKDLVVTGEVGSNPKVCVWSTSSPEAPPKVSFCLGKGRRAVSCLGFSACGGFLAVADLNNDHYVSVWSATTGDKVTELGGGTDKILDLAWCPGKQRFCTAGIKHICFWDLKEGALDKEKGIFKGKGPMCTMTTVAWLSDGTCVTGGANGRLYVWEERTLCKTVDVHGNGNAVHTLNIVNDVILSGGRDLKVHVLDKNFTETTVISTSCVPRAVDMKLDEVVFGTKDGSIHIHSNNSTRTVMESHSDGEVWGLAIDYTHHYVLTTGDDNAIKVWCPTNKKCIGRGTIDKEEGEERKAGHGASTMARTPSNQQSRAIAVNSSNGHVAVCHNNGKVTIRSSVTELDSVAHTLTEPKEWSQAIAYSPDGSKLAVGSHDNSIYIYDVSRNYSLAHTFAKHSSFITGLDWSEDSSALHTTSGDYELLFWSLTEDAQVPAGASTYQDEKWHTWTVPLGWPVMGVFGTLVDYTHVNSTGRSHCGGLVAVGNDWGLVELYKFPNAEGAKCLAFAGHSEHVTRVRWGVEDKSLFSVGGYDQTLMQWRTGK